MELPPKLTIDDEFMHFSIYCRLLSEQNPNYQKVINNNPDNFDINMEQDFILPVFDILLDESYTLSKLEKEEIDVKLLNILKTEFSDNTELIRELHSINSSDVLESPPVGVPTTQGKRIGDFFVEKKDRDIIIGELYDDKIVSTVK